MTILSWWENWSLLDEPSDILNSMDEFGLLTVYPELAAMQGVEQDPRWHPEGDVLKHSIITTDRMALICKRERIQRPQRFIMMLAALCHDMGKPATTKRNLIGRWIAPGHAQAGEEPTRIFLERIKVDESIVQSVVGLVIHHMAHADFVGSKAHVKRLMRKLQVYNVPMQHLAWLVEADASARPPAPQGMPTEMQKMLEMATQIEQTGELVEPIQHSDRIVQGRDVMLWLGLEPGVQIGKIVNVVYEAQKVNQFTDQDSARQWVTQQDWTKL